MPATAVTLYALEKPVAANPGRLAAKPKTAKNALLKDFSSGF
jgi:hypothetical protein